MSNVLSSPGDQQQQLLKVSDTVATKSQQLEGRAEEMAQRTRALAALEEDPASVLSSHTMVHSIHNSSSGDPVPSSDFLGNQVYT